MKKEDKNRSSNPVQIAVARGFAMNCEITFDLKNSEKGTTVFLLNGKINFDELKTKLITIYFNLKFNL
jgi:hypothetical protein